jgi:mRNA interferase MazF
VSGLAPRNADPAGLSEPRALVSRVEVWQGETPKHGRRPYLVLHRNAAIGVLAEILVCPLTRTIRGIDTEVSLDEDDGLPETCVASLDNLMMLPVARLTERITKLRPEKMAHVRAALDAATDC